MIDSQNWNYCTYVNKNFKAYISLGGEPTVDQEVKEIYWVNVTTLENQSVSQRSHKNLNNAINQINSQYAHWTFTDPLNPTGGCSSCSAH